MIIFCKNNKIVGHSAKSGDFAELGSGYMNGIASPASRDRSDHVNEIGSIWQGHCEERSDEAIPNMLAGSLFTRFA